MNFDRRHLNNSTLINFYKTLLWPRLVEEKMLLLLRQGRISQWLSGVGQEAIAVGSVLALQNDEYILPSNCNLGAFTARNIPLSKLIAQLLGKPLSFTKGRDQSLSVIIKDYHIAGIDASLAIANGIALADKLENNPKITLAIVDQETTNTGDFYEALNLAMTWNLPVIFLIENNTCPSSHSSNQPEYSQWSDKVISYNIETHQINGNNLLEVYHTIRDLAVGIHHNPRPVLLECTTFRMPEEASGAKPIQPNTLKEWQAKDPVAAFERLLIENYILRPEWPEIIYRELMPLIDAEVEKALNGQDIIPKIQTELQDMYSLATSNESLTNTMPQASTTRQLFADAANDGLRLSMQQHANLVLIGQNNIQKVNKSKAIEAFLAEFGADRVRQTPPHYSAALEVALGLSIKEYKTIIDIDSITAGFNHLTNYLAHTHYYYGQQAGVVIRIPTGISNNPKAIHSQSNEAWFTQLPGLKVAYPAFADDAKGLMMAALNDPNPVIYLEHNYLAQHINGEVPEGNYTVEIGKAKIVREGTQVSIITYGLGVHWALEWAEQYPQYSAEIIDLRSLQPWDKATVEASVKKTSKVLILHEDNLTGGFAGEIAAHIIERCFEYLDGPVMRCASLDTAVPMNEALQNQFLAKARLARQMEKLIKY